MLVWDICVANERFVASNRMGATSGVGNAYHSWIQLLICVGFVLLNLVFCVMCCRSLFCLFVLRSLVDPPGLKLEKIWLFWRKIVIFHTKCPNIVRASLRSVQFFLSTPPPLTWNPGSAPGFNTVSLCWSIAHFSTYELYKECSCENTVDDSRGNA